MKKYLFSFVFSFPLICFAQNNSRWINVDSVYQPLPNSVHVFMTNHPIDTGSFRAFYVIADLKDKKLDFNTDTSNKRRLTPLQFFQKNSAPLVVVNGSFFSFETNQNLNIVIKNGEVVAYDNQTINGRGKDTFTYRHVFLSAIGISKKRTVDVAWLLTDSSQIVLASQWTIPFIKDSIKHPTEKYLLERSSVPEHRGFEKWKMYAAIGGGPVLVQNGEVKISNNEELKFNGKAINDKHPRTAMGYTADNKIIILVIQGRSESSGGATLVQEAQILKDLGCVEALNLDGGGSSCMLVNGKETIKPSDKEGERAVPAVFIIK